MAAKAHPLLLRSHGVVAAILMMALLVANSATHSHATPLLGSNMHPWTQRTTRKLVNSVEGHVHHCPEMAITVVYAAFLWPVGDNWQFLIRSQLTQLKDTGLSECAPVHVAMSTPAIFPDRTYEQLEDLLARGRDLVFSVIPQRETGQRRGSVVSIVHENSFEYPGIRLVWLLANELPPSNASNHAFLYFHSKGMVFHGGLQGRLPTEIELFQGTVVPWREILDVLVTHPNVTRVGMHPNYNGNPPFTLSPAALQSLEERRQGRPPKTGFIWYNFWWARASYLQTVQEPMRIVNHARRYYYESWLSQSPLADDCRTCYRWHL